MDLPRGPAARVSYATLCTRIPVIILTRLQLRVRHAPNKQALVEAGSAKRLKAGRDGAASPKLPKTVPHFFKAPARYLSHTLGPADD